MELTARHVYKRMVKIGNVLEVDNKTAMCLKKTVFGQYFQIMLHIAGGFKIAHRGMDDYLSPQCLYCDDRRYRKRVYALLRFERKFDGHGVIHIDGILHITEKTLLVLHRCH